MLLRETDAGVIVIGQASHAWLSGQLARAWGNERFPVPSPRQEVCLAAVQHDIGWVEWDLRPTLNPGTGYPHSFMEMPTLATHIGLWSHAPDRLLSQSAYAALLVSMHGTALYARRDLEQMPDDEAELVRAFLSSERARQTELIELLGPDQTELAQNQRLIWTWDSMSLAVCLPWDPHTATKVPSAEGPTDIEMQGTGENRFKVRPWPFRARELQVRCEGRLLTAPSRTEDELYAALREAPLRQLNFTLV